MPVTRNRRLLHSRRLRDGDEEFGWIIAQMTPNPRRKIIEALHESRMRPYLDAAHNNDKHALALYRWHLELTASVQTVLGVTEVFLRNAMDSQLQVWNDNETGGTASWLLSDPASPLRSLSAGKRKQARDRATDDLIARDSGHARHGVPVSHDDVLAHITFGLWKELLPNHQPGAGNATENANRKRLWDEALENAFQGENDPDGEITFWRVAHLHHLRNRVSHMEPLLTIDVKDKVDEAFRLVRSIDPKLADWLTGVSNVASVLKQRPDI